MASGSSGICKLEQDLCRCCHSEGIFKSLSEPIKTASLEEIYVDMLKDCYAIDMVPIPGLMSATTYTICEVCIIRLRDASEFKKQVLLCEERFKDIYNKNGVAATLTTIEVEIKEEIPDLPSDDVFKEDLILDDDSDDLPLNAKDEDYEVSEDLKANEEEEEVEKPVKVEVRKKRNNKKKAVKTNSVKSKRKKKETLKEEPAEEDNAEKKQSGRAAAPKFRLNEEDYKQVGEIFHCTRCEKTYDKINTLKFHVKSKHYKIPRFKCTICMREFMTPAPLTVHKLEVHNVDDRFNCMACNKIFNTKVQLRKHINNFHMLGERYKCEFCDYESFSFEGMYKHKFKHKTVKDYHCKFCRKSFLRKTTLDLHERIHTGDRRKVCLVCGQAFVQKASLNYHMTKYHPEVNF